ncbi:MAG: PEP-CTERM sorting domain-containing protein [Fimbriimonadaceae bacterium]
MKTTSALILLAAAGTASAQFTTFTSRAAWEAAAGGTVVVEGFEGNATGSLVHAVDHDLGAVTFRIDLITATSSGASITSTAITGVRALSMNADDGMRAHTMTFDGVPLVTAFGFDFMGANTGGDAVLIIDGTRFGITNGGTVGAGFFGVVSTGSFASVQFGDESPGSLPTEIFTLDGASFVAVPEPGTMIALGLGASALLARRRKKSA